VILTGGLTSSAGSYSVSVSNVVARYNLQGFVEDLPSLKTQRFGHGCGSYTAGGKKVIIVVGGEEDNAYRSKKPFLISTEKLTIGDNAWSDATPLSRGLTDLASVSFGNNVYIIGGEDDKRDERAEIYKFDGETWQEVGQMKNKRSDHSATVISTTLDKLCL